MVDRFAEAFAERADRARASEGMLDLLLIGSSIVEQWRTSARDLAPWRTLNLGVGGTRIRDQERHLAEQLPTEPPRRVLLYCGSNDISGRRIGSRRGEAVAGDVLRVLDALRSALPDAELVYVGIVDAPAKQRVREELLEANRRIAAGIAERPGTRFLDPNPLVGAAARAAEEGGLPVYLDDGLHFTAGGYAPFARTVRAGLGVPEE